MLGYIWANDFYSFTESDGLAYMADIRCDGNETSLFKCSYAGWGIHDCAIYASVVCDTSRIRLIGGSSPNEGRVEVRSEDSVNWGTVCHNQFDMKDADVICRMLGYPNATQVRNDAYFGQGTGPIYMADLRCDGNESSIFDCPYAGWTIHDCDHGQDAGVVCRTDFSRIRLVEGSGPTEGRVEVRPADSSRWGTVCHNGFDLKDAEVVCRMLGYPNANRLRPNGYFGIGTGPIYLEDLQCDGTESSLFNCSHKGWRVHDCYHGDDVGVVCDDSRIRLVGGSSRSEGRVEVRPADSMTWGTVCHNRFDMKDADVVCKMLGYPSARQVRNNAYFGTGRGPIYMDDLRCNGDETSLFNCSYPGWMIHDLNCSHDQAAGVECTGEPFLLVSTLGGGIFQIEVKDGSKVNVLSGWYISLDYDPMTDFMYWTYGEVIERARRDGSITETIVELGTYRYATGLRLDHAGGNVYWSDNKGHISVARKDGSFVRTLLTSLGGVGQLVLDPRNGHMYWVNWPNNIDRAAMDGSNRTTIIRNLFDSSAIAIDYTENRLYYSDNDAIYSSDMLGNNTQLVKPGDGKHVLAVAVDDNYVYWIHYRAGEVRRLSKSSMDQTVLVDDLLQPNDIYLSTAAPPNVTNACSSSNGGCQELCLAHPGGRTCACRDSWELQEDGRSCCPSGYTAYGGACFKAYDQDRTYSQAREVCAADGALLAMPKDRDVDNFVRELKNAVNKISHFWFGLNDGNNEGEWVWEDGTPHDISTDWNLWQPREPNGNEGENCANYYGSSWNDAPCSSAYKFICQLNEAISCSLGHFRCGHGLACILSWKRCDGIADCTDGSDEEGCVCEPIPEDFEIDSRLAMLPNQLGQLTFEEIQNSSVVELLNSSYSIAGKYHPEMRTFISAVIFPQCNVSEENKTLCSSSPNAGNMTSCMGTQLVPCRSWCEEVLNMADDWIKNQLPRCRLFPSSDHNCWNPNSAKKGNEVCYHGVGINYRGTWSKTTYGADCVEWSAPQAGYYKTEFPWANLDNNYCRNPTGLERPFCLTEDGSQEECDVIPCDAEGCWDRGPPNYGKRTPTKRFYYVGEKVTYSCNEGYTIKSGYTKEVRCIGGGNWQYDKPSCSVNHRQRLQEDLLEISSTSLPPENVIINFTGSVVQLVDLTWQDSRLSWDPKYYDNVTTLSVHGNDIWTPTLTLKRNADPVYKGLQKDVPVRVSSDGLVEWSVETLTTTVCDADPFFFPADTMECDICFSATTAISQIIQGG
ncbi:uncharacterized protein LOC144918527 [Branchiostoma floridae x Branchiostoma belcheri]